MLLFILFFSFLNTYSCDVIVHTKLGDVIGSIGRSRNGKEYHSFQSVPFAVPPIGNLRFQPPVPIKSFGGTINGTVTSPECIQKNYVNPQPLTVGKEDCLYLNIYVPKTTKNNLQMPVLVFFYGGGFLQGSNSFEFQGPDYFMDHDLILVIPNYRLSSFGFLSTLDDVIPGNMGLKDQSLALKWIQENIHSFNGDPNKVTIMGESSGSVCVHLHLVSSLSKGLFHKAIMHSGSALSYWGRPQNDLQRNYTKLQALFVGCGHTVGNSSALLKCLQNVKAEDLAYSMTYFNYSFADEPPVIHNVVVEKASNKNSHPFLTKLPKKALSSGNFNKVPLIHGLIQDEGIERGSSLIRNSRLRNQLNADFDNLFAFVLHLNQSTSDVKGLLNKILNFYLDGQHSLDVNNPKQVQAMINILGDRNYFYDTYQNLKFQILHNPYPVYTYNLNYKGAFTFADFMAGTTENIDFNWNPCHGDDLQYLFQIRQIQSNLTCTDLLLSKTWAKAWADFVKTGNPDPDNTLKWKPLNKNTGTIQYLNISGSFSLKSLNFSFENNFYNSRMKFWLNQDIIENS